MRRSGRALDRSRDHQIGRRARAQVTLVEAVRGGGVSGRDGDGLARRELAHGGQEQDIAQHAARDDPGAARRHTVTDQVSSNCPNAGGHHR